MRMNRRGRGRAEHTGTSQTGEKHTKSAQPEAFKFGTSSNFQHTFREPFPFWMIAVDAMTSFKGCMVGRGGRKVKSLRLSTAFAVVGGISVDYPLIS